MSQRPVRSRDTAGPNSRASLRSALTLPEFGSSWSPGWLSCSQGPCWSFSWHGWFSAAMRCCWTTWPNAGRRAMSARRRRQYRAPRQDSVTPWERSASSGGANVTVVTYPSGESTHRSMYVMAPTLGTPRPWPRATTRLDRLCAVGRSHPGLPMSSEVLAG